MNELPSRIYSEVTGSLENPVCIFIHGGYHTGISWTTKPDGTSGWAQQFAEAGFSSIVTDWPGVGRSGSVPNEVMCGQFVVDGYSEFIRSLERPVILVGHSIGGTLALKTAEQCADIVTHVVLLEPAPYGNIQESSAPTSEQDGKVTIDFKGMPFTIDLNIPAAITSQNVARFTASARFPKDTESIERYTNSLVPIAPRILYERFNIQSSQLRLENYAALKNILFLVVTTDDAWHVQEDTVLVADLKAHDISVEHWRDGAHHTAGSGHIMMAEQGSDELAADIIAWMKLQQ